jgi:hypothetical protein
VDCSDPTYEEMGFRHSKNPTTSERVKKMTAGDPPAIPWVGFQTEPVRKGSTVCRFISIIFQATFHLRASQKQDHSRSRFWLSGQVDQMVTSKDFTEPSHRSLVNSARDIEWIKR